MYAIQRPSGENAVSRSDAGVRRIVSALPSADGERPHVVRRLPRRPVERDELPVRGPVRQELRAGPMEHPGPASGGARPTPEPRGAARRRRFPRLDPEPATFREWTTRPCGTTRRRCASRRARTQACSPRPDRTSGAPAAPSPRRRTSRRRGCCSRGRSPPTRRAFRRARRAESSSCRSRRACADLSRRGRTRRAANCRSCRPPRRRGGPRGGREDARPAVREVLDARRDDEGVPDVSRRAASNRCAIRAPSHANRRWPGHVDRSGRRLEEDLPLRLSERLDAELGLVPAGDGVDALDDVEEVLAVGEEVRPLVGALAARLVERRHGDALACPGETRKIELRSAGE